jgi:hypothetical protein
VSGKMIGKRIIKAKDVQRISFTPIDVGFTSAKVNSGKPFGKGKIFFKAGSGLKKKRVFFKPVSAMLPADVPKRAEEMGGVAKRLAKVGVPVVKVIRVAHEGQTYLAVESFLTQKQLVPKLFPINPKPLDHTPYLLSNLTMRKNSHLIKNLAQDTAKILNLGISSRYFDFFGFYPNAKGEWERKVMDLDHMYIETQSVDELKQMLSSIRKVWAPGKFDEEYSFFLRELLNRVRKPKLKTVFAQELRMIE